MHFTPRPYQTEAIKAATDFINSESKQHGLLILPTGSGKSVVVANIAKAIPGKVVVLQPSKEILEQNYAKYTSYGLRAGIYSASAGVKHIDKVTFATIGSIHKKWYLFKDAAAILIDECHLVNSEDGMYKQFLSLMKDAKFIGLTATPYRLVSDPDGAKLEFLNRTNPRIFDRVLYHVQNSVLFDAGHLAKLEYFSFNTVDRSKLQMNSNGTDFTESSLRAYYRQIGMPTITANWANKLLKKRKNLLVFSSLLSEASQVMKQVPGSVMVSGETPQALRESILKRFKNGDIRCVINVGVLTTGFDYPELECVLMARSTMSLALYYQIVGRAMRPHKSKQSAWIVDVGGNIDFFGKIETMTIRIDSRGQYSIWNNGRQLTNVAFTKE